MQNNWWWWCRDLRENVSRKVKIAASAASDRNKRFILNKVLPPSFRWSNFSSHWSGATNVIERRTSNPCAPTLRYFYNTMVNQKTSVWFILLWWSRTEGMPEIHKVDTTSVKQKHLLVIEKTLTMRIEPLFWLPIFYKLNFNSGCLQFFGLCLNWNWTCVRINRNLSFESHSLHLPIAWWPECRHWIFLTFQLISWERRDRSPATQELVCALHSQKDCVRTVQFKILQETVRQVYKHL